LCPEKRFMVIKGDYSRSQAEGTRKTRLRRFGGETADFCIKHGFKVCPIPAFPDSLQPSVSLPDTKFLPQPGNIFPAIMVLLFISALTQNNLTEI